MLAATVVVPCLSRALDSSGSGVFAGAPGRALLRGFVVLRNLEPNSCPALPSDAAAEIVDLVKDNAEFEAAVEKMLGLIFTVSSWPGFTSSITCYTLLKTTLTATDSTHRCAHMSAVHSV